MTYAVIESGSKQYKIKKGDIIDVELLDTAKDAKINLDKVLLVSNDKDVAVGTPYVKGAVAKCTVVDPAIKDKKVVIFKFKSKSNYHKKAGHRQKYTRLVVEDLLVK